MPTLFKRSNGIYYVLTDGKNGRRRWISSGVEVDQLGFAFARMSGHHLR